MRLVPHRCEAPLSSLPFPLIARSLYTSPCFPISPLSVFRHYNFSLFLQRSPRPHTNPHPHRRVLLLRRCRRRPGLSPNFFLVKIAIYLTLPRDLCYDPVLGQQPCQALPAASQGRSIYDSLLDPKSIRVLPPPTCCLTRTSRRVQVGTITSQLRIQSILSPADPSGADEPHTVSTPSNILSPYTKQEDPYEQPLLNAAPSQLPVFEQTTDHARFLPQSQCDQADIVNEYGASEGRPSQSSTPRPDSRKLRMARPPLRSSIACLRCRKSKIKCDNDGGTTACETCIKGGHQCQYPDAIASPVKKPDAATTTQRQEREGGSERKRRRLDDPSCWVSKRSSAYAEQVLSYPFLRGELWDQVFGIYKLHFSTELPFLHLATLKEKIDLRQKGNLKSEPDVNLVLLGILTLTARFHNDLVKYVAAMAPSSGSGRSRQGSVKIDPNSASEFYASSLTTALGSLPDAITVVSVERVQAFLMLGLYEWTRNRPQGGVRAWMYVGVAIRMAQALRLGCGDAVAQNGDLLRSRNKRPSQPEGSHSDIVIEKEIRRRTMFSCFILDRLLAVGDDRVSMISSTDLHIQLPCSEFAFDLASEVYTGFLNNSDELAQQSIRLTRDDSVLSRFVKLVDLWGEITRYSFSGGRATEGDKRPWDSSSTFMRLRKRLDAFYSSLPDTFTLSPKNFYRHDNHQATSMYVSLHVLGSVCQIMIHREYIPFIPIRCSRPAGPLDPPLILDDGPLGFWEESAEHVFKSARDIVGIIELSGDKLPQSSLVLFAIWTAAFCGLYAIHFPQMDTRHHMIRPGDIQPQHEEIYGQSKESATGVTFRTLTKLAPYLPLAGTYLKIFKDCDRYFTQVRNDFYKFEGRTHAPESAGQQASGRSVQGGGGREWKAHKGKITSNGNIFPYDERNTTYEGSEASHTQSPDRDASAGVEGYGQAISLMPTPSLSSAPLEDGASRPRPGRTESSTSFTPINSVSQSQQPTPQLPTPQVVPSDPTTPTVEASYRGVQLPHDPLEPYYPIDTSPTLQSTFIPQDGGRFSHDTANPLSYIEAHQNTRLSCVLTDLSAFSGSGDPLTFAALQPIPWDAQYFEDKPSLIMPIGHSV